MLNFNLNSFPKFWKTLGKVSLSLTLQTRKSIPIIKCKDRLWQLRSRALILNLLFKMVRNKKLKWVFLILNLNEGKMLPLMFAWTVSWVTFPILTLYLKKRVNKGWEMSHYLRRLCKNSILNMSTGHNTTKMRNTSVCINWR